MTRLRERYDAALETFRAASKIHTEALRAYRAREIDDAAYLAARAAFDAANKILDAAEASVAQ